MRLAVLRLTLCPGTISACRRLAAHSNAVPRRAVRSANGACCNASPHQSSGHGRFRLLTRSSAAAACTCASWHAVCSVVAGGVDAVAPAALPGRLRTRHGPRGTCLRACGLGLWHRLRERAGADSPASASPAVLTRPLLLQELLGTDAASDLVNGKRQRATERRGARSTSKYRGVTHHCRTGRCELRRLCTSSLKRTLRHGPLCTQLGGSPMVWNATPVILACWSVAEKICCIAGRTHGKSTWCVTVVRRRVVESSWVECSGLVPAGWLRCRGAGGTCMCVLRVPAAQGPASRPISLRMLADNRICRRRRHCGH